MMELPSNDEMQPTGSEGGAHDGGADARASSFSAARS